MKGSLFAPAEMELYCVHFDGFADIEVVAIGEIEAIAQARHYLMTKRGVRRKETLLSGRVTFVSALE